MSTTQRLIHVIICLWPAARPPLIIWFAISTLDANTPYMRHHGDCHHAFHHTKAVTWCATLGAQIMAMACMLLAGKAEDCPRTLDAIIRKCWEARYGAFGGRVPDKAKLGHLDDTVRASSLLPVCRTLGLSH